MRSHCLELGSEQEGVASSPVVQRLLAHPISCEMHDLLNAVPQGKCEHAVQLLEGTFDTPVPERCKECLAVRVTSPVEAPANCFKLGSQVKVIVDLTIEGQHKPTARRHHGLMARGREINDGQSAVAKSDSSINVNPGAIIIWAAGLDLVGHVSHNQALRRSRGTPISNYSAHSEWASSQFNGDIHLCSFVGLAAITQCVGVELIIHQFTSISDTAGQDAMWLIESHTSELNHHA